MGGEDCLFFGMYFVQRARDKGGRKAKDNPGAKGREEGMAEALVEDEGHGGIGDVSSSDNTDGGAEAAERVRRNGGGEEGGCTHVIHGRSRKVIRPSHLYNAGAEHVRAGASGGL